MIPGIWLPAVTILSLMTIFSTPENPNFIEEYLYYESPKFAGIFGYLACIFAGLCLWSFSEYMLHRYLFHFEDLLPNNPYFFLLHYVIHGIHHQIPMDPDRLVFPPVLAVIMYFILTTLYNFLFGPTLGTLLFCGFGIGYVLYDMFHFTIHHGNFKIEHLKEMKNYHTKHHYIDGNRGYGITSKFWDKVFHTELH